jgi:hypothetical protein
VVKRNLSARSYIPAIVIVLTLLLALLLCEDTSSSQIDTLDLYFQWAYPISISDMKLVDFDGNGEFEILIRYSGIIPDYMQMFSQLQQETGTRTVTRTS